MSHAPTTVQRPRRYLRGLLAVAASLLVAATVALAPPAGAVIVDFRGTLSVDDPTMDVVTIDGDADTCVAQVGSPVHYTTHEFKAKAAGHYGFALTSTDSFAAYYIYRDSFDPLDGMTNCIAADNTADEDVLQQKIIELEVATPGKYVIVVIDDGFEAGGDYDVVMETPGGVAISPNQGTGKPFARFGSAYTCPAPHTAQVTWSDQAGRVDKAVFKAGNHVVRTVRTATPGSTVQLKDLPDNTRWLTGIITLRSGDQRTVVRKYYRC